VAIARPANRRLETGFDGLEDDDRDDLAAARADLRDAAATERRFDRRLLALKLPPPTEAVAACWWPRTRPGSGSPWPRPPAHP
jgi:hypothetical protein